MEKSLWPGAPQFSQMPACLRTNTSPTCDAVRRFLSRPIRTSDEGLPHARAAASIARTHPLDTEERSVFIAKAALTHWLPWCEQRDTGAITRLSPSSTRISLWQLAAT